MVPIPITSSPTVGDIVAADYRAAEVFKRFGIDFCCGGKKTMAEVCRDKGVDLATLEAALQQIEQVTTEHDENVDQWSLSFLVDYIVNVHHSYVRRKVPLLLQYSEKVARVHGHYHIETVEIARLFNELQEDLLAHMLKEEHILFPYIKNLEAGTGPARPPFGTVQNPIRMMETEHEAAGEIMHRIDEISGHYSPPAEACNTYRVLYAMLRDFENNLHRHVHLENNVLFPRAVEMEGNRG